MIIDNVVQIFFMEAAENVIDIHMSMCYEVLDCFNHLIRNKNEIEQDVW